VVVFGSAAFVLLLGSGVFYGMRAAWT